MAIETETPGEPFRRTDADADADRKEAGQNLCDMRWKEWPNEAGFNCFEEHRGPEKLTIEGKIPVWCAGSLFRTGPGLSELDGAKGGTYRVSHWFDGFAHSHRFDISSDGPQNDCAAVTYSSRRQAEPLMGHIRKKGLHGGVTFGQRADPCVGILAKCMSTFVELTRERKYFNVQVVPHPNVPEFEEGTSRKTALSSSSLSSTTTTTNTTNTTTTTTSFAPTNASHRAGKVENLWLATDASVMMRVDPSTLEPIGPARQHRIHPLLRGPLSAAHAQRDPATGDLFNFNTTVGRVAVHRIFCLRANGGTAEILAEIRDGDPVPAPASYIHSFYLTPSYVIFCLPATRYRLGGLHIAWEKNIIDSIAPLDPTTDRCRWFVVDRLHGRGLVARFESPAAFFFHTVNAFEERANGGLDVFADVVEYPNHDIMRAFYYDNMLNRNGSAEKFWSSGVKNTERHDTVQPTLVRYKLHIARSDASLAANDTIFSPVEVVVRIPGPHVGELPTVNPDYLTRRTRYVYSGAARGLSTALMDCLVKTEVSDSKENPHSALFWTGPRGHSPGEPIFVARPPEHGGTGQEDDGVILSVVLNGDARASYLLCLDARTMREIGRARCSFAVPFGFHGVHVKR